ncbi:MAG TPA: helix-turn-helix domain-containing protein [Pyrinomonadaceae bacterium]|jgi:tetratricopeptide (TPR) repeat protein
MKRNVINREDQLVWHDPATRSAHIAERCREAHELEEAGQYEAACEQLREVWPVIGQRPDLSSLKPEVAAGLLLRAGTLSGWIGSARQLSGAQEEAKNLISESIEIFAGCGAQERAHDARIDLAICYWREGALDEARVMLSEVISAARRCPQVKARALLNTSVVEISAQRFRTALEVLTEASPIFEQSESPLARGRFHNQRALCYRNLGTAEQHPDYFDRALEEYAMASGYFEQSGHTRYLARVENNVGNLLYNIGRYNEALEHMDHARDLLVNLRDSGTVAQINEARAKVFVALERYNEAEVAASGAVYTLERGDENSLLAEALTTHGVALARTGREAHARKTLQRASVIAGQAGDPVRAAHAHLTLLEELGSELLIGEWARHYQAADQLSGDNPDMATLARLRACALRFVSVAQMHDGGLGIDAFLIGGTLEQEVSRFEGELIRRALDQADGHITSAARILGTSHQALSYMLSARHPNLLLARTPVISRRRSIMKKEEKRRKRSRS